MKVVKKQELDSLTRKYFYQQKTFEVISFILIVGFILFISSIVGNIYMEKNPDGICLNTDREGTDFNCMKNIWGVGIIITMLISLMGFILFAFLYFFFKGIKFLIENWIENNWEKAEERAMEDLK